ncbi:otu domain containing protein 6b [Niveomyces insectorum RCEF 264]|uniref:Otu domain containing protein 6b n=1 Tax=Niveomyces insectorum RCEF 264 TaxID=1081102 RepID=A0A167ZZE6_9HYPO|nr:otu domain containing protein 6b [Niveomyces insectorum RCEF 264]
MESLDALQARHRRELRELQGRVTNKKKNATKKTRKGVNDECAALERALHEKHAAELRIAAGERNDGDMDEAKPNADADADDDTPHPTALDGLAAQLADASLNNTPQSQSHAQPPEPSQPPKKRNRQKERLARRAAAQEDAAAAAAAEAAGMVDYAAVERAALAPLIARAGRVEHFIQPDGHCLFSAVADQMAQAGRPVVGKRPRSNDETHDAAAAAATTTTTTSDDLPAYRVVRHTAAQYMAAHPDDFAPFLDADDEAEEAGGLDAHIAKIRDTAMWGGQLELAALAGAYGVDIRVLHDGQSELIQPQQRPGAHSAQQGEPRPTLWLVYYRHGFGLGEHYNSLRAKEEKV